MEVRLDVAFDTVWLTQQQIAELFGVQKAAISKHMKNIFSSCELIRERVVSKMETTASDGKKYQVDYERVILIDNFIDDRTLLMLDKRTAGVEATVYTRYNEKVELDFAKHNDQYEPIQRVQLPHSVHDRYLKVGNLKYTFCAMSIALLYIRII